MAREGIFDRSTCAALHGERAKTKLPICLKRREALSLGSFAERVRSWLNLVAAEVPCTSDRTDGRFGPFCLLFRPNVKGIALAAIEHKQFSL